MIMMMSIVVTYIAVDVNLIIMMEVVLVFVAFDVVVVDDASFCYCCHGRNRW